MKASRIIDKHRTSLFLGMCLLFLWLPTPFAHAISLPQCITDSQESPFTLINSAPCGIFGGSITTRKTNVNGTEVDVSVKYMVHVPNRTPKGLVVLFSGRVGNAGIQGNQKGGAVTSTGQNFLVRSAQLFAEEGYLAVTIDRPLRPGLTGLVPEFPTILGFDRYRVSPKHAQDIVTILHDLPNVIPTVNTSNLDVLLAGISRGAISAVAQSKLSNGISIQSPVTSGNTLFVGCTAPAADPTDVTSCLRLQPSFVKVPVDILAHELDGCPRSTPADSEALLNAFLAAGVESNFDDIDGGFDLSSLTDDLCGNLAFHSFLGIETEAVEKITESLDDFLGEDENNKPIAQPTTVSITGSSGDKVSINLAGLANDPDGDALSFSLSHPKSSRGADLSIEGSVVTYTINETGITDGFVYIVSDGKGGKSAAVVTVEVD